MSDAATTGKARRKGPANDGSVPKPQHGPSLPVTATTQAAASATATMATSRKSLADSWYAAAMDGYRQQNPRVSQRSQEYNEAVREIYDAYFRGHKALQDSAPHAKISSADALKIVEGALGMKADEAAAIGLDLSNTFKQATKNTALVLNAFMQIRLQQPDCRPF